MDSSSLQARVLARLSKDDAHGFPATLPPQPPQHAVATADESSSDDVSDSDSSSDSAPEALRIDIPPKPAARARKAGVEERHEAEAEDSPESEDEKKLSLITASRLCSRRELARCVRRQRRKLQIALAAMILSVLLFLLSTMMFLEAPQVQMRPEAQYRSEDIPQEAWLAAGWGLPPVLREQRAESPKTPSTSFHQAGPKWKAVKKHCFQLFSDDSCNFSSSWICVGYFGAVFLLFELDRWGSKHPHSKDSCFLSHYKATNASELCFSWGFWQTLREVYPERGLEDRKFSQLIHLIDQISLD